MLTVLVLGSRKGQDVSQCGCHITRQRLALRVRFSIRSTNYRGLARAELA